MWMNLLGEGIFFFSARSPDRHSFTGRVAIGRDRGDLLVLEKRNISVLSLGLSSVRQTTWADVQEGSSRLSALGE